MQLVSFSIENFRKFRDTHNKVLFATVADDVDHISSTLLIGQNNAGKTCVVEALQKASGIDSFLISDFNFKYLQDIYRKFNDNKEDIKKYFIDDEVDFDDRKANLMEQLCPYMKFSFEFKLDSEISSSTELLTNIAPLVRNELENGQVYMVVKYKVKEQIRFINDIYNSFFTRIDENFVFSEFIEFMSKGDYFDKSIYVDLQCIDQVENFSISDLIKVRTISYDQIYTSGRLSSLFSKIYNYKLKSNIAEKEKIVNEVKKINEKIAETSIGFDLSSKLNNAFSKTLDKSSATMLLKPNLSVDSLLKNVMKYVYKDGNYEIPEDQFGMGYTNLMLILANFVDYVDNSPEVIFKNKINILIIEEPESFMHPQMQKLLIQNINDSIKYILEERGLKVNCQLLITSHSSNIVYGKIHSEDTFNNINYIALNSNCTSRIFPLNDDVIMNTGSNSTLTEAQFKYLKKYIKYHHCDLFFADACIVVEGDSEQIILPYYIEKDDRINKKYISILNVGGAYAHIYKNLLKSLDIPVAIITDLDISGFASSVHQLEDLNNRKTTNEVLNSFNFQIGKDFNKQEGKMFITTQNQIGKYYPTSFEEAFILTNASNQVLLNTLSSCIPRTFKKYKDIIESKSHCLQVKLAGKKGDFASLLLHNIINADPASVPILPLYIQDAFTFIAKQLSNTIDKDFTSSQLAVCENLHSAENNDKEDAIYA